MSPYTNSTVFADTNSNQHSIKIYSIVFFLNPFHRELIQQVLLSKVENTHS